MVPHLSLIDLTPRHIHAGDSAIRVGTGSFDIYVLLVMAVFISEGSIIKIASMRLRLHENIVLRHVVFV